MKEETKEISRFMFGLIIRAFTILILIPVVLLFLSACGWVVMKSLIFINYIFN